MEKVRKTFICVAWKTCTASRSLPQSGCGLVTKYKRLGLGFKYSVLLLICWVMKQ